MRLDAIQDVLARYPRRRSSRDVTLCTSRPVAGERHFILDAELEDDDFLIHFDGLKKVEGRSELGDFHYLPVLFHEGRQVRKPQSLLLEVLGLAPRPASRGSSRRGRHLPRRGLHGHDRPPHARPEGGGRRARRDDPNANGRVEPPKLLLNDHCQVCEFRRQCHDRPSRRTTSASCAASGEKEIKGYARKGHLHADAARPHVPAPAEGQAVGPTKQPPLPRPAGAGDPRQEGLRPRHAETALQPGADLPRHGGRAGGGVRLPDRDDRRATAAARNALLLLGRQQGPGGGHLRAVPGRGRPPRRLPRSSATAATRRRSSSGCGSSAERTEPVDRVLASLVNMLSLVYAHFYFPTLLQRAEGRRPATWAARGATRRLGHPEPRVAGAVGGDRDERVEAEARRVQPGGLRRPCGG